VQRHHRRVDLERRVRHELRIVPAAAFGPPDPHHVLGEDAPKARAGDPLGTFGVGHRRRGRLQLERNRRVLGRRHRNSLQHVGGPVF
jgi:hypothetical protein